MNRVSRSGVQTAIAVMLATFSLVILLHHTVTGSPAPGNTAPGTDDQAVDAVKSLAPSYTPWLSRFTLLPAGTDPVLFALQAALGAGFIGYYVCWSRTRLSKKTAPRVSTSAD